MFELFKNTKIDFVGARYYCFALSFLIIGSGLVSLAVKKGPNLGIDFTGGSMIRFSFKQPIHIDELRSILKANGMNADLQSVVGSDRVIVRLKKSSEQVNVLAERIKGYVTAKYPNAAPSVEQAEYVGPTVGKHLGKQALMAILWSLVLIIIYIAFRFDSMVWGVAAIIATFHDVLATIGFLSIINTEFDVTIVAAILTIAGYSTNDTIVIFDRMRENLRLSRKESFLEITNRSVNETLSRSIITNLTVLIAVFVLLLFGGEVIHNFAVTMCFGSLIGTFSSIYVAAPIVYEWKRLSSGAPAPSPVKGKSIKA